MFEMRKLLFLSAFLLSMTAAAQNKTLTAALDSLPASYDRYKSHINLEFASSANAYFTEGNFDELAFKINRVRMEIFGRLNSQLSYHFRQSYNKYSNPYSVDNLSSSIEYANIKWHNDDGKFELVAGKQFVAHAGYEGYVNGVLVREFSDFNNNTEIYQAGLKGVYYFTPDHLLMMQVTNIRSASDPDIYLYGLPDGIEPAKVPLMATVNWNGYFADRSIHLMYSASAGQQAAGKNLYYLMCGNIYKKGPILAYLDVLYSRSGLDSQQRITTLQGQSRGMLPATAQNTEYFTVIANCDYQFHPKWNAYVKGAYETAGVYEANGIFEKGRYITSWNAQACLEWFPLSEDGGFKVFAHFLYKNHELSTYAEQMTVRMRPHQRLSMGIVYIIPVF